MRVKTLAIFFAVLSITGFGIGMVIVFKPNLTLPLVPTGQGYWSELGHICALIAIALSFVKLS